MCLRKSTVSWNGGKTNNLQGVKTMEMNSVLRSIVIWSAALLVLTALCVVMVKDACRARRKFVNRKCPFCGAQAGVIDESMPTTDSFTYWICKSCRSSWASVPRDPNRRYDE